MTRYILRRLLSLIPVLLGISVLVFSFLRLIPGDPALAMLGERANEENLRRVREEMGLDRPLFLDLQPLAVARYNPAVALQAGWQPFRSQYLLFMGRVLRGDLGTSVHSRQPVREELFRRLPATIELAFAAMLVAMLVGIPAGINAATHHNSPFDYGSMVVALIGVSMPIFWLGLMLVWAFAVLNHWLPVGGRMDTILALDFKTPTGFMVLDAILSKRTDLVVDALRHLVLPAVVLGTIPMAIIARMTRAAMLEVLRQDYVRTATAKGLTRRLVVLRHALKNALLPVVTVIGLQVGLLLGGAVLTETIFAWPGVGRWIYDAISARDYAIVQGAILVLALIFVLVNLAVDLSYALLDPRIRYE
jgi:peptide/nickel transport system permease protein